MQCPVCKQGEIHVIVPIIYEWDTAEDGKIIQTDRTACTQRFDEDIAICKECNQRFDIDYENDKVIPAYQDTYLKEV